MPESRAPYQVNCPLCVVSTYISCNFQGGLVDSSGALSFHNLSLSLSLICSQHRKPLRLSVQLIVVSWHVWSCASSSRAAMAANLSASHLRRSSSSLHRCIRSTASWELHSLCRRCSASRAVHSTTCQPHATCTVPRAERRSSFFTNKNCP